MRYWIITLLFSTLLGHFYINVGDRTPKIFFYELVFFFLLFRTLARACLGKTLQSSRSRQLMYKPIDPLLLIMMAAYIYFSIVSIFLTQDYKHSIGILRGVVQSYLLFWLVWRYLRGDSNAIKKIVAILPLIGLVMVLIIVFEVYTNVRDVGLLFTWSKTGPEKLLVATHLGSSNYPAGILSLLMPISIAAAHLQKGFLKLFTWVCIGVMLTGIIVCSSQGAVGSLLVAALIWCFIDKSKKQKLFRLLLILVCITLFVHSYPVLTGEIFISFARSLSRRVHHWDFFRDNYQQAFFLGAGKVGIREYGLHNCILTAFWKTGIFGCLAFTGILSRIFFCVWRNFHRKTNDLGIDAIKKGVFFSFIVAVTHSMVEQLLENNVYDVFFWSIMAISYAIPVTQVSSVSRLKERVHLKPASTA